MYENDFRDDAYKYENMCVCICMGVQLYAWSTTEIASRGGAWE